MSGLTPVHDGATAGMCDCGGVHSVEQILTAERDELRAEVKRLREAVEKDRLLRAQWDALLSDAATKAARNALLAAVLALDPPRELVLARVVLRAAMQAAREAAESTTKEAQDAG